MGRGQQGGRMPVVPAGVHLARVLAGVWQAGGFMDGQGVHVGAQPDHAPAVAALAANHAHHAGLADAAMHLDAQRLKRAGHNPGGPDFLEAQFRMRMQIAPQRRQFVMK
ncbi:hypothetical protein G6F62_015325 [Rhizopus arrhizus]|nr:hypothetical protein G6F62_015325 [Rhizopus arrhizus]